MHETHSGSASADRPPANTWRLSNEQLGMVEADAREDLWATLQRADRGGLQRLRQALLDDQMVRGVYNRCTPGRERGCVVYWAFGIHSKEQLLRYDFGSLDNLAAVRRMMRFYDSGQLTSDEIAATLDQLLAATPPARQPAAPPRSPETVSA